MAIKINGNTVIADNQAFTTTSTVSATGTITGGNVLTGGTISASGNATAANLFTSGVISATGNITAGNIIANVVSTGPVSTTGNVTGGNILTGGSVSATGNITGNFFIGNGSQLTGIDATAIQNGTANVRTFLNGNVTTSAGGTANVLNVTSTGTITTGTASVTGNVIAGNVLFDGGIVSGTGNIFATNTFLTGVLSATGNVRGGNINSAGQVSATGDVHGGNILTGGIVSATGNVFGGNALFAGNLTVNGNVTYINSNVVTINDLAINLANNAATAAAANNGGIEVGPQGSPYITFLYNSSANTFTSSAGLSAVGNVVGANFTTGGLISASGNVTGGNIRTAGAVTATGNVNAAGLTLSANTYINGSTNQLFTDEVTTNSSLTSNGNTFTRFEVRAGGPFAFNGIFNAYANTSATPQVQILGTGGTVSAVGNITGGNLLTGGLISATGNISGGNLNITGNIVDTGALSIITGSNGNLALAPNGTGIVTVSSALSATGGITGASFATTGAITGASVSASGNVTGGNLSVGTGTVTVGNIVNSNANGVGNIGSSSTYFNTVFAKATSAQYADLAEKYAADADYAPGTVVAFGGSQEVTISNVDSDTRVAGVVSTNPSFRMNDTLTAEHTAMVALTGRVPTRVTGSVRKGDLMVSAGNGVARAEANPQVGTVIGKALADSEGDTVIEVVVGRF